jgi:hypothetical protein
MYIYVYVYTHRVTHGVFSGAHDRRPEDPLAVRARRQGQRRPRRRAPLILAQNPKSEPPAAFVVHDRSEVATHGLRRHLCRVCTAFAPRYTASAPRQVLFAAAWITGEFAEFIGNYNEVRSAAPPRHRRLHDRSIDR